jgi:xylulokinase
MNDYYIGIDSGTQSTKAILLDAQSGETQATASVSYDLIEGLPPGYKEQHPATWTAAADSAIRAILNESQIDRLAVRAIGISGQQHGFVPLDEGGDVIRPAKLWCDTSTSAECAAIVARLGGLEKTISEVGNGVPAGFTASKILWLREHEPSSYARLRWVLLPHDYLNFWLTGSKTMECGDASGTAFFDVRRRDWSGAAIDAIDPRLKEMLPPLIDSGDPAGKLRTELAQEWGLSPDVIVSAGGGDNMMGAIGTGNVRPGVVTVSLGTSGTIYAFSSFPVIDAKGEVAAFCDSTGNWLPLVCTMNVTVATEMVRELWHLSHEELSSQAALAPAGCDGLILVPFFEGERTPDVPNGTGVYFGIREQTFNLPYFARAAMEGTTLGLDYGLGRLRELGIKPVEIRATGGGSRSPIWRQIMADVFNAEVVCVKNEEGAAVGAALQAMWCEHRLKGRAESIAEICDRFITLDEATRTRPEQARVATYRRMRALQDRLVADLREVFPMHRDLI